MQDRRQQLLSGQITLPAGVDPFDYIFDGVVKAPEDRPADLPANIDDFQQAYVASFASGC